ncbi:MAG TPA: lipid A deacylase LpxR family protein [Noviherbaspirillum sp.]|uniref:lipid A deacylase LpxR family protein n=1 Tax=Noviherbaspirillum sp. TaxID=1926288 RepID=UPI002B49D96D|nr:lipid A deacylase LpxR family protein [Noviherbaspirillum sp.]HJV88293.1 lipid A deacylase LpxR family protein [Noviherbaspirillum sp.]
MHNTHIRNLACCILLAACKAAGAATLDGLLADYRTVSAEGRSTHVVDIDNDSLLLNRDDGFYTSGMRYTYTKTMERAGAATTFGWRFGQELYTASDIKLPPQLVGPPDHPYAGWLYGGFFREVSRADGTRTRFGIDLGCLGPCAGGDWTQTTLHRILRQPQPQGWSKQMRNEPGVVLYAEVAPVRWSPMANTDISPSLNGRFGNIFTDVGTGFVARAGQLNILPGKPAFYGFLRADARAVAYNATLQGGYFSKNNPHTVDPKRFVGEAEAGVAWNRGAFGARMSIVRRSNEIRELANSIGAQNYLRLQFSYAP